MEPHPDDPILVEPSDWAKIFPLYYRILLLGCFGVWCWCLNLHGLRIAGIDARTILQGSTGPDDNFDCSACSPEAAPSSLERSRTATEGLPAHVPNWWCYLLVPEDIPNVKRFIILATGIVLIGILTLPFHILAYADRMRFFRALGRVLYPSLTAPVFFCDVIMADILTSFARVFSDSWASLCDLSALLLPGSGGDPQTPDRINFSFEQCGYSVFGPLVICLPYLLRFRQCINEALSSPAGPVRRRHLANAAKYASSFPVVLLSGYEKYLSWKTKDHDGDGTITPRDHILTLLSQLWLLSAIVNTLYSIYWDTAVDWNLGYTARGRTHCHPFLRPHIIFDNALYYAAIAINVLLRTTWTLKISPHLPIETLPLGGFTLEWLEVLRRWLWVYFRVEREWLDKKVPLTASTD
ncbi:EXS family-domain-containing protein [Dimargaris cristalligena]|uniref:EXS family-domain-containing protein n=1 Tax=Dimargaris cristalligena TaxID=215637 RepID=A0A4P9ZVK2_9FUNG|nr:EXS family-domain-containing protein [Dimargaris cristalligena]|eukprot:RKP36872.1 EXS family-domain-containing protein [Dimargaris cristalligena]